MSGNSIGQLFQVTTFGESHGPALGCVIDGCPAGLAISTPDIQTELNRRRPGSSSYVSQRQEADQVEILSGVFEGTTTGAPIGLLIRNHDAKSHHYDDLKEQFRPGHGDYVYQKKYGIRDHRGGGRASARETVMRVAAGAIAKKYLLEQANITIRGYLAELGEIQCDLTDWSEVDNNPFFCPDPAKLIHLEQYLTDIRKAGDSIGARVNVVAENVPAGLGEPVFDRLDAELAKAFMSIPAVKAVEFGSGFEVVTQRGSEHRDEMTPEGFLSNNAGGILAGISTGQTITASIAVKPAASILTPAQSVDANGQACTVSVKGRHDPCPGLRAVPIAEAMMAIVLMDHVLRDCHSRLRGNDKKTGMT